MTREWNHWTKKGVYQIKPVFPFGLPDILDKKTHFNNVLKKQAAEAKGLPYYGAYLFGQKILIITDVDLVKQIMIKDFEYFVNRSSSESIEKKKKTNQLADKIWFKKLVDNVGEDWKNTRSTFTPIFTSGNLIIDSFSSLILY